PLLGLLQHRPRRSVIVAEHLRVLQELAPLDHGFKFAARDEVIFPAILLAAPGRAGGEGYGELQVRHILAQLIHKRGLAGAGGCRDDIEYAAHSRFCTCSRHFSISAFICRPSSVMRRPSPATPEVFESRVLASRLSSCKRKSSFLPTSPPWSSSLRKWSMWVCRRTNSS